MSANLSALGYLVAAICFIVSLRGLSSPATSQRGLQAGMAGMTIAILITLISLRHAGFGTYALILVALVLGGGAGFYIARKIAMTAMPQLVAAFHSLVGLAAVFVAAGAFYSPAEFHIIEPDGHFHTQALIEMGLGVIVGAITFSGSLIAFAKLQAIMGSAPLMLPARHLINIAIGVVILLLLVWFVSSASAVAFWLLILLSFAIGILLIVPIGGADMPVVVSMLNSYSGWAAAGIGFTLNNQALIITGALVGSSGAILSYIMCKAMNRSFISVILGGFGDAGGATAGADGDDRVVKTGSADDAAFMMENAQKVIIVPGYGMAVAQAQHSVRELYDALTKKGVEVKFAIHPVAGRMPGHMNVLLAEANIPYDVVFEMDDINSEFGQTDVAYVIGANDITNPAAKTDKSSPIYGMPVLDVDRAKAVFFVKRSMGKGYAGIDNTLFYQDNTMMLFGDAKKMTDEIVKAIAGGGH